MMKVWCRRECTLSGMNVKGGLSVDGGGGGVGVEKSVSYLEFVRTNSASG